MIKISYVGSELGETAATPENDSVLDLPLLFQLTNYLKFTIVTYGLPLKINFAWKGHSVPQN
jgi:hypothetical protein